MPFRNLTKALANPVLALYITPLMGFTLMEKPQRNPKNLHNAMCVYVRNIVHLEFGLRFSTARWVPDERVDDHLLFRTSS